MSFYVYLAPTAEKGSSGSGKKYHISPHCSYLKNCVQIFTHTSDEEKVKQMNVCSKCGAAQKTFVSQPASAASKERAAPKERAASKERAARGKIVFHDVSEDRETYSHQQTPHSSESSEMSYFQEGFSGVDVFGSSEDEVFREESRFPAMHMFSPEYNTPIQEAHGTSGEYVAAFHPEETKDDVFYCYLTQNGFSKGGEVYHVTKECGHVKDIMFVLFSDDPFLKGKRCCHNCANRPKQLVSETVIPKSSSTRQVLMMKTVTEDVLPVLPNRQEDEVRDEIPGDLGRTGYWTQSTSESSQDEDTEDDLDEISDDEIIISKEYDFINQEKDFYDLVAENSREIARGDSDDICDLMFKPDIRVMGHPRKHRIHCRRKHMEKMMKKYHFYSTKNPDVKLLFESSNHVIMQSPTPIRKSDAEHFLATLMKPSVKREIKFDGQVV